VRQVNEGWLFKKGGGRRMLVGRRNWKRRYFVLLPRFLFVRRHDDSETRRRRRTRRRRKIDLAAASKRSSRVGMSPPLHELNSQGAAVDLSGPTAAWPIDDRAAAAGNHAKQNTRALCLSFFASSDGIEPSALAYLDRVPSGGRCRVFLLTPGPVVGAAFPMRRVV
jgi:hypothetical protein